MTSHRDQDVPAGTSDTSVVAPGCSAMGLPESTPRPQPSWGGNWGLSHTPLQHPLSPVELLLELGVSQRLWG